ncbi:hypothetical protein Y032_0120g954 [Ancylostoma ceylanicum]|nr:hypothetical protein Y032_0120g954 [Ancylostoma ceylanicum]
MNEISPDSIKGMGRVGCLYIEEEEPGRRRWTRMRGERALPHDGVAVGYATSLMYIVEFSWFNEKVDLRGRLQLNKFPSSSEKEWRDGLPS